MTKKAVLETEQIETIKKAENAQAVLDSLEGKELNSKDQKLLEKEIKETKKELDKLRKDQEKNTELGHNPAADLAKEIDKKSKAFKNLKVAKNQANAIVRHDRKIRIRKWFFNRAEKKLTTTETQLGKAVTKKNEASQERTDAERNQETVRDKLRENNDNKLSDELINKKYNEHELADFKKTKKELKKSSPQDKNEIQKLDQLITLAEADVKHIRAERKFEKASKKVTSLETKKTARENEKNTAETKLKQAIKKRQNRINTPKYKRSSPRKFASKVKQGLQNTFTKHKGQISQRRVDAYAKNKDPNVSRPTGRTI